MRGVVTIQSLSKETRSQKEITLVASHREAWARGRGGGGGGEANAAMILDSLVVVLTLNLTSSFFCAGGHGAHWEITGGGGRRK